MVKIEVATSLLLGAFFVGYVLGAFIGTSLTMLAFFVMVTIANVLWQRNT